jgi:hypothetical protein
LIRFDCLEDQMKTFATAAVLAGAAFGVLGGAAPALAAPAAPVIPGPGDYVPPTLITEVTVPPLTLHPVTPVIPTIPTTPTDLTPPPHTPSTTKPPVVTDPKFTPNPPTTTSHTPPKFPKGAPETGGGDGPGVSPIYWLAALGLGAGGLAAGAHLTRRRPGAHR